jgi:beta-N-acetylhexosaminidase
MSTDRESFIDDILSKMTTAEKVGAVITFEYAGTLFDKHVVDKVCRHFVGGLRVTPHIFTEEPYGTHLLTDGSAIQRTSPYAPPAEYAELLNRVQRLAADRRVPVPLHISSDQEGDYSQDVARGGVNLFPSQMGMAATGDDELIYRAYRAVARQQRAFGVRMLHTPCLDVNVEPANPEICTRAFSDDPEVVARVGTAMFKALRDENVTATGKHFPGRGNSKVDLHYHADVFPGDRKEMDEVHLAPYRTLIAEGIPAIMTAHTIYPCLDPDEWPASVSRRITTGLLREEMGFEGVITTDAIGMKGVMGRFSCYGEAAATAIAAGADLVLTKCDASKRDEVYDWILKFVEEGRIPADELDMHVRRLLRLKYDYGLFEQAQVDPAGAERAVRDEKNVDLSAEVARRCSILLRDREGLLPLKPDTPVLVVQQRCDLYQNKANDVWYHANMLQEFIRERAANVEDYETALEVSEADAEAVLALAGKAEVTIVLCAFWRSLPTLVDVVERLIAAGRKVVVVTNTPYPLSVPEKAGTVLLTFSVMPPSLEHAADVLYGKGDCPGQWPLKRFPRPE